MEPYTCRQELPPEHVDPYWIGRTHKDGLISDEVAVELLAELPLGPPAWGPNSPGFEHLLEAQMAAGCWNIAFPLMGSGYIEESVYLAAERRRAAQP